MNIILTGMKHCGKSTHGKLLAERIGAQFYDTDDELAALYSEESGEAIAVREIFRKLGDTDFRKLEERTFAKVLVKIAASGKDAVISLGGGMLASSKEFASKIRDAGLLIHLENSPFELYRRSIANGLPSFIDPKCPEESFMRLFRSRKEYYISYSHLTVNLEGFSVEDAFNKLFAEITEYRKNAGK